jgi:Serine/threonine protein kinase
MKTHLEKEFCKQYEIIKAISKGGFGTVYDGVKKSNKESVVIKKISSKKVSVSSGLPSEVLFLKKCKNIANVIQILDFILCEENLYIVFEQLENNIDLFDLITDHFPLEENVVRKIFKEILKTIQILSNMDIYHFDVKDENILLGYPNLEINKVNEPVFVKLIDFGNMKYGSKVNDSPFEPTRVFCPPEYINYGLILPREFTVWSLGCLLYNMLNGDIPFQFNIVENVKWHRQVSQDLTDLTNNCLLMEPSERIDLHCISV